MAIAIHGSPSVTTPVGGSNAITANCPTSSAGDVRVALLSLNDNTLQTWTIPSGWTQQVNFHHNAVVFDSFQLSVFTYVCVGSDPSTAVFTASGGEVNQAVIVAYSGVDNAAPWDTSSGNDGGNAAPTGSTVTTANTNELVLWLSANDGALTSTPAGFADRVDGSTNQGETGTFVGWYDKTFSSSGATGSLAGATSGSNDWIVVVGALKALATASYVITAATGSFSLTGEPIVSNVNMPAAQGAFALTGEATALTRGHTLSAAMGQFLFTGEPIPGGISGNWPTTGNWPTVNNWPTVGNRP